MNLISKDYKEGILTPKTSKSTSELLQYFLKQLFAYLYSTSYENFICFHWISFVKLMPWEG